MPIKSFKPYTPSRRTIQMADFSILTRSKPEKSLTVGTHRNGGRNNTGMLMVRHIGGGSKRLYRSIDFKRRDIWGIEGRIDSIEYDPFRSSYICLIVYKNGAKRYILQPEGMKVGDVIISGPQAPIKNGNALPLANIPEGAFVHAVELYPGKGAVLARSAGAQVQIMAKSQKYVSIKLPSGEIRLIPKDCMATLGQIGNVEHNTITIGNAGRHRRMGVKPTVRGTAMNAVDHPHGGGRGKSKGANHPRSPWNQGAKGLKTRSNKIWNWMILQDRRKGAAQLAEAPGGGA